MCVGRREGEVEIERSDAVTAANYCCSIFHTVCLISHPVERDRDSLSLFLRSTHAHMRARAPYKHTHIQGSEGGEGGIVF